MNPPQDHQPGRRRILVADDNDTLRFALSEILRCMGHRVDCVVDGCEAVRAATERTYDLILLDVQMPEMGGFEAASRLKQTVLPGPNPLLVGMSADSSERDEACSAGMDDFLPKPVLARDIARILVRLDGSGPRSVPTLR